MRYAPLCLPTAECKIATSGSTSFRQPSAKCKTITCHLSCDIAAHAVCKAQRPVMILQRCACHPRSAKKNLALRCCFYCVQNNKTFWRYIAAFAILQVQKNTFWHYMAAPAVRKGQNKNFRRYMTAPSAKCKITNSGAVSLCLPSTRCKTTRFGVAWPRLPSAKGRI